MVFSPNLPLAAIFVTIGIDPLSCLIACGRVIERVYDICRLWLYREDLCHGHNLVEMNDGSGIQRGCTRT